MNRLQYDESPAMLGASRAKHSRPAQFSDNGYEAPPGGLEPPTHWLIPRPAGLCRLSFQKPAYAALLDGLFKLHRRSPAGRLGAPNKYPGAWETLGGFAALVSRIVMFGKPSFQIVRNSAVVSAAAFATQYVRPNRHCSPG